MQIYESKRLTFTFMHLDAFIQSDLHPNPVGNKEFSSFLDECLQICL